MILGIFPCVGCDAGCAVTLWLLGYCVWLGFRWFGGVRVLWVYGAGFLGTLVLWVV